MVLCLLKKKGVYLNIFIDLGAYKGLYINRFKKSKIYKPDFKIYAFECNPYLSHINYGSDVIAIRKAAWIYDGEVSFFINTKMPARVQGSSIYKEKITGDLDKQHPIKVPCIDFSKWLLRNFKLEDNILIKINIEGAEYNILEKCISDGSINYIKKMWIRWHWQKCKILFNRHKKLTSQLKYCENYEGLK